MHTQKYNQHVKNNEYCLLLGYTNAFVATGKLSGDRRNQKYGNGNCCQNNLHQKHDNYSVCRHQQGVSDDQTRHKTIVEEMVHVEPPPDEPSVILTTNRTVQYICYMLCKYKPGQKK